MLEERNTGLKGREIIRHARESHGLSREVLSRMAGTSSTGLYKLESGAVDISKAEFGKVAALAHALGLSLDEIAEAERSGQNED